MYLNNRAHTFNLNFFRVSKSTWYVQMGLSYCHLMDAITQQPPASTESNAFKMIQVTSAGQVQKDLVELSFLDKLSHSWRTIATK